MKKIYFTLFSVIILSLIMLFPFSSVKAETLNDMKNELSKLQGKYDANNKAKALTQSEIEKVKNQISSINDQIEQINNEIVTLNKEIEESNKKIKKMDKEIKSIMNYYQISSSSSVYLEYIFSATTFTDLIYRLSVSEQLSQSLENSINEYNRLIKENENRIKEIENKKIELKKLQEQLKVEESKLGKELDGITKAGVDLKDDINALKKTINLYEKTFGCSKNEQISTCASRYYASKNPGGSVSLPSAAGFYKPMSAGIISAPFGHHDNGLDIAVREGTAVRPVADGVVSEIWPRYKCGGNMVFIVHNVGGVNYTSAYFHLWTYNVHIGQKVTHSTAIGTSGGQPINHSKCSSNCSSVDYNNYDSCTTGPHLHLQLSRAVYNPKPVQSGIIGGTATYAVFNSNSFDPAPIVGY